MGADVNAKTADGRTSLHVTAAALHTDVINFLIGKGADVNAKDKEGQTPLMVAAAISQMSDAVKFLKQHGVTK